MPKSQGHRALVAADKPDIRSFDRIPQSWGPRLTTGISTGVADLGVIRPGPDDAEAVVDAHFLITFLSPQRGRELRLASARSTTFDAPSGSVDLIPAGAGYYCRWEHPVECVLLSVAPDQLTRFAEREFDASRIELRPVVPGAVDRTAARIAGLMRDEMMQARPPGRLYMESLATALLCHTVQTHSSLAEQAASSQWKGGLPPRVWRETDEFIRENLASDMALSSLSQRAGLSYSHFLRAFRQTAGVSPHRYIMLQRAQLARELAATSRLPLKQIALQCGFANQSHMTTVMKTLLNETPGDVRRRLNFRPGPASSNEAPE
ncbi:AraC family transcriptional regulator [Sandaracinobacter neustonicus]|nr:AraC family transcriptional regulator [Sandaracinobacter neustonicus]